MQTGYSTKTSSDRSIDCGVLQDAYHKFFGIFGDFYTAVMQDTDNSKITADGFLYLCLKF